MALTPLAVHDNFNRGAYPDVLDLSTSTSGHTWSANPEFLVDIDIEGPPGDAYCYSDRIDGSYADGQFSIGTIYHGYANGIVCAVPNNIGGDGWHRLVFRYDDNDNYSFVIVGTSGSTAGLDLANRVAGVNTVLQSDSAFTPAYVEVRMSGTNIEVWAAPNLVVTAPTLRMTDTITERVSSARHGLASNERGDDSFEQRANWLSFGYSMTILADDAQTAARTGLLLPT